MDTFPTMAGSIPRRRLLTHGLAAAGAAVADSTLAAPLAASSGTTHATPGGALLDVWADLFAQVPESFGPTEVRFDRTLPPGLQGTLFRVGPARMHRGDTAYTHWFDGDGMAHAYRIGAGRLTHRAQMVRTGKYVADERAGRFLHSGFGTALPDTVPLNRPDDINTANISMLPVGDEVLALWEGGSPWRLDPASLRTLGRKKWSDETDGLPFSAHPKIDRDGTIWSFGYMAGSGRMVAYRLDRRGALRKVSMFETGNADMVHDFAITRRWLVFTLMPFLLDPEAPREGALLPRYHWHGNQPGTVLLVDKDTLQPVHRIDIPATGFFHVGNAWEDGDSVRVQLMRIDDFERGIKNSVSRPFLREPTLHLQAAPIELVVPTGRGRGAAIEPLGHVPAEFPVHDPRFIGEPTRHLFFATRAASMPEPLFGWNAIARWDRKRQRLDRYDYGPHTLSEEHVFVPRRAGSAGPEEGDGWLIGTACDWARQRTRLSVFDARALSEGPIATAWLPYAVPPGLHGRFV